MSDGLPVGIQIVLGALLTADRLLSAAWEAETRWGIFLDGEPVVLADSVVSVDYKKDSRISNYQVEQGGFESYNKVEDPFQTIVRFAAGGSEIDRQAFLSSIQAVARTRDLYDVVTPEAVYQSANVVLQDYRRTAHEGVGLIQVDVRLEEVRVTGSGSFNNTRTPSGADTVSGGNVQTSTFDESGFSSPTLTQAVR